MTKVKSSASPLESVTAEPVASPSAFFRITFAPVTALASAVTEISNRRILLRTPFPVTCTVEVSISPSMKSIVAVPEITASFVFAKVLSTKVSVPVPAVSIPTALVPRVMPFQVISLDVAEPNLIPAPAELAILPVKSPFRSLI